MSIRNKITTLYSPEYEAGEHDISLDASSFESLWVEYWYLANTMGVPRTKRELFEDDKEKQRFINRVNNLLAEKQPIVQCILRQFSSQFPQLNDYLKFLPPNFKIFILATGKPQRPLDLDFDVEQVIYKEDNECKNIKEDKECKNIKDCIISKILKTNYFELGECWAKVFKQYYKAFMYYKKAYKHQSSVSLLAKVCKMYTIHSKKSGLRDYETEMILERQYAILERSAAEEGKFYENYAWYANLRERYDTEVESLKLALKSYLADDDNCLIKSIRTYNLLFGAFYNQSQKVEALDCAQRAYNSLRNDLPLDTVAATKYNLGLAYSEFDKHQHTALHYYSAALEDFKRFYNNKAHFDIG